MFFDKVVRLFRCPIRTLSAPSMFFRSTLPLSLTLGVQSRRLNHTFVVHSKRRFCANAPKKQTIYVAPSYLSFGPDKFKRKRYFKWCIYAAVVVGAGFALMTYPGYALFPFKSVKSTHSWIFFLSANLGQMWPMLSESMARHGWIDIAIECIKELSAELKEIPKDNTEDIEKVLANKKGVAMFLFSVFNSETVRNQLADAYTEQSSTSTDDSASSSGLGDVKNLLGVIYSDVVLQNDPETSCMGLQALFALASDATLKSAMIESGGLSLLCRVTRASNPAVSQTGMMALSSLIHRLPNLGDVKLSPSERRDMNMLGNLGMNFLMTGKPKDAILLFSDLLEIFPDDINFLDVVAKAHFQLKNYDKANAIHRKILEERPDLHELGFLLATNLFTHAKSNEDIEEAILLIENALESGESGEQYSFMLAKMQEKLGRIDDALYTLREFCKSPQGKCLANAQVEYAKMLMKHRKGVNSDLEKGRRALEGAIRLRPYDSDIRFQLALCYKVLGRWENALSSIDDVLVSQPDNSEALAIKGRVLKKLHRWAEMEQSYEKLAELDSSKPDVFYQRAIALEKLQRSEEAIKSFSMALSQWDNICSGSDSSCREWFHRHPTDRLAVQKIQQRCEKMQARGEQFDVMREMHGRLRENMQSAAVTV
eukprot:230318_1